MRSLEEIKSRKELEIGKVGLDGGTGILHMTGLRKCTVIWSLGGGWEHVSVCPANRTPTWEEMCQVKDIFWGKGECVVQYHPEENEYVNLKPNCLHLWRPTYMEMPVPPTILV